MTSEEPLPPRQRLGQRGCDLHKLIDGSLGDGGAPFCPEVVPHHVAHGSDTAGGNGNLGVEEEQETAVRFNRHFESDPRHLHHRTFEN